MEKYKSQDKKAKNLFFLVCMAFGLLFLVGTQQAMAQTPFTVNWPLTANLATVNTTGNVGASATIPGSFFTASIAYSTNGLTGTGLVGGSTAGGNASTACSATFNSVSLTGGTTISPYMDFDVTPNAGNSLNLSSLSFSISSNLSATTHRRVAVAYSTDGGTTFTAIVPTVVSTPSVSGATAPVIGSGTTGSLCNTTTATTTVDKFTFSLSSVSVANGQSLKIRIIIWRSINGGSSGSSFTISPVSVSGTTLSLPASLTTVAPSGITTTSASTGGSSLNAGGGVLLGKGVVWGTSANPTLVDNKIDAGTTLSDFTSDITGLTPETGYNVRAFATNDSGTQYGSNASFRTLSAAPTSATTSNTATGVSQSAVNLAWNAASFPSANATSKGYVVLRALFPAIPSLTNDNGTTAVAAANTTIVGSTAASVTNLQATGLSAFTIYNFVIVPFTWDGVNATTYNYYRTSLPVFDGTSLAGPPSVTTVVLTAITHSGVTTGGSGVNDGGGVLTGKGVVWSTNANPTTSDNKLDAGTATANFTSVVTTLSPQTAYNIRAYATNNSGTQYGSNLAFRTLSAPATTQAANLKAVSNTTSTTKIDFTWTAASFPTSGATNTGYLLLYAVSPNVPSLTSVNGQAPTVDANTTVLANNIAATAASYTSTTLNNSVSYNFLLVPYTWDGANASTYNYLIASAPTASSVKLPVVSGRSTLCAGEQITLTSNSTTGNTWLKNGVAISGANAQQLVVNSAGSYTVSVNWGTISTVSVPVNVTIFALPVPNITSTNGTKISKGTSTQLSAGDGVTYLWSPNKYQWIDNVNIPNPTVKPDVTTTFTVTVTNANGCSKTESITIEVENDFKVTPQTMITPNGDGKNDVWIIKNIDAYPDNEVKVFDASGRQVYRKQRYNNSWDGTYNGQALPTGSYSFIIYFGSDKALVKGYLTILK